MRAVSFCVPFASTKEDFETSCASAFTCAGSES